MNAFALVAAALSVLRLILFVALHVMRSDYNIVEHAVSDYAVGRTSKVSAYMTWYTAGVWLTLLLALLVGPAPQPSTSTIAQLVALVVIFVVLPFLPTDLEGQRRTATGTLHHVAAIAWFALSYSLTGNFSRMLADAGTATIALTALRWIALVSLVALCIGLIPALRKRLFGIAERIFLLAITVFYLLAAVLLMLP